MQTVETRRSLINTAQAPHCPWSQPFFVPVEVKIVPNTITALDLVDTVYLMSILTDHRRSIDRYIDYFGSGASDLELRGAEARRSFARNAVLVAPPVNPATRPMCLNDDQEI